MTLLLLVGACRRDAPGVPDATPPIDPAPTSTTEAPIADDAWFAEDRLLEVSIAIDPADWEALRHETRDVFDTLGGSDCLADPFSSPFRPYPATVTVDGDRLADVGLSKKGFLGSLSTDRPSLRIDTDEFVDGQVAPNGTERITLNNNLQDPSTLRQCLTYDVFRRAGVPAPRCNFALVTVNGEDLGVYTHVEAVRKDFLRRHFASPDGDLYEGTLSDFREGWTATFDPKGSDTDPALGPVYDLLAAAAAPDDALWASLEAVLDLEAFARFWAVEGLVVHGDGYASNMNNFFLYRDDLTGLATFVPWGTDGTLSDPGATSVLANAWLAQRLYALPEGRAALLAEQQRLLDEVWDEDALQAEIDRLADLVVPHAADPDGARAAIADLRAFVDGRRAAVQAELDAGGPDLAPPEPRDPLCLTPVGTIDATFDTTWDSLALDPFAEGLTGTLAGVLDGGPLPPVAAVGTQAGGDGYGNAVISVLGIDAAWVGYEQLIVVLPMDALAPGVVRLDLVSAYGVLQEGLLADPDSAELSGYAVGELVLTDASPAVGAPIRGTFSGELYRF